MYTHEELASNTAGLNCSSLAFRFRFASGYDFLVLGDNEDQSSEWIAKAYGSYLESDIVQAAHHGMSGACRALYRLVLSKIVFWPTGEICMSPRELPGVTYNDIYDNESNDVLINAENCLHYHASTTTVVNMKDLSITTDQSGFLPRTDEVGEGTPTE